MKTRRMMALVGLVALGMLAGQAGAAIECTIQVSLQAGQTGVVAAAGDQVRMDVWAVIASADGTYANDSAREFYGALKTTGTVIGNLAFTANASFAATGFSNGTQVDLNGDGGLDVGSTAPQVDTGWVHPFAGPGVNINPGAADANKVLLGSLVFTATNVPAGGTSAINWSYRVKTGLGNTIDVYQKDAATTSATTAAGSDTRLAVGSSVSVVSQAIPEPMTMVLLGVGGMVIVAFRKRRHA